MRVFVTGATGFVGFAVTQELLGAGQEVLGLARSEEGANALTAIGAQVHRGDLEDLESLRSGAALADGVIHCAFNHDFSKFAANCELDRQAIEALGSALASSERPLVVTGGIGLIAPGRSATEEDRPPAEGSRGYPRMSEQTADLLAGGGVRTAVMRLPQVHDPVKQGFVTYLVAVAREKGVSAYVGEGHNRWAAVHRLDAARLYRLALEKAAAGHDSAVARYHAVGEEGVPAKEIAEAIGRGLQIPVVSVAPEQAVEHFGFLGNFAGLDMPATSDLTQQRLGWQPEGPGLIADLDEMFRTA
ncbi:SDR family oxidoreductase [Paludibaculum fermentans]|uniref:SDR family oxidoreductase n=1 Tax=Paludibaculum fermentans TaxID=1473598 RepID=A0A7S7NWL4_PALFE|nr:SDR family oxidoreductase [Paludibaculum fermentans]QOY91156.1 SDR family oxidoreductase [Paludibaculum fermentans]